MWGTRFGRSLARDGVPQRLRSLERTGAFLYTDSGRVNLTPAKWVGFLMRFGPGICFVVVPVTMLLLTSGCMSHLPLPEPTPTTLSQQVPPQRSVPVHGRRVNHAARPVPPGAPAISKAQMTEEEKLFRGFVDWQGAQDAGP